jgi:hypothetical protein
MLKRQLNNYWPLVLHYNHVIIQWLCIQKANWIH